MIELCNVLYQYYRSHKIQVVLLVVLVVTFGCNSVQKNSQTITQNPSTQTIQPSVIPVKPPVVPATLTQLPDLNLLTFDHVIAQTKYYSIPNSTVKGASIILVSTLGNCDGSGCSPEYFRFLHSGTTYTLLTKYSSPITDPQTSVHAVIPTETSAIDIPALDIPATIIDPTSQAVLTFDPSSLIQGDLFSPGTMSYITTIQGYQIYALSGSNSEYFYIDSVDGKELLLKLTSPTIGDIMFTNGMKNAAQYGIDANQVDFCMSAASNYANAVKYTQITKNDLTAIGASNGQTIYELTNASNPLLTSLQLDSQSMNQEQSSNKLSTIDGTELTPYPNVSQNSILFWIDPFGRIIRLIDTRFMNACGD